MARTPDHVCTICTTTQAKEFQENHVGGEANAPDLTYEICSPGCHPAFTAGQYDAGVNLSHSDPHSLFDVVWGVFWGTLDTIALGLKRSCDCTEQRELAARATLMAFAFRRLLGVVLVDQRPRNPVPDPFGRDLRNARYPGRRAVRPIEFRPSRAAQRIVGVRLIRLCGRILHAWYAQQPERADIAEQAARIEAAAPAIVDAFLRLERTDRLAPLLEEAKGWIADFEPILWWALGVRRVERFDEMKVRAEQLGAQGEALVFNFLLAMAGTRSTPEAIRVVDDFLATWRAAEAS
jgi:hypothetical protein